MLKPGARYTYSAGGDRRPAFDVIIIDANIDTLGMVRVRRLDSNLNTWVLANSLTEVVYVRTDPE